LKALSTALWLLLSLSPGARADQPLGEGSKAAHRHYLRGMLLERRGEYAEALKAYGEAHTSDPQSPFVCREAAELALEMGLLDRALDWAGKVLELDPKNPHSHILLGQVRWARGEAQAAQAAFEAALKIDSKSAESIFSLANLLAARDPKRARELLEGFLARSPEHAAEAHTQIAKLDLQAGRLREAQSHLREAIALEPDVESLPARHALAQSYEAQRSTEAALAEYLEMLRLEPQNLGLLNHVGQLHFLAGQWEQARERFQAAKALAPSDPTANHWLALYAERQGDYAQAAGYLKASSALGEDPAANLRLSYYLTQAGRLKEAVSVLEGAGARWPKNDQLAYFLALGYDDLKQHDRAIKLLRRVLALKPDSREARYQLAALLEKTDRIEEAESEFRLLLAQKPEDAAILNYLGYSLADRGLKLAEAEGLIREAVRLDPANGAYLDSLGWVRFKQGRSTEAIQGLLAALERLPEDENVWDHLGEAYAAAGQASSAWFAWRQAESLTPSEARKKSKAEALQGRFGPEELGGYYLDYLKANLGGIRKLGALCELKGAILGRSFSYSGILAFRAPQDLDLELLGPLFIPMFRLRLNREGFVMDSLRLEGLRPEAVMEAAHAAFSLIRDYLSGGIFSLRPARYKKGWRSQEIAVPGWTLSLSPDGLLPEALWPQAHAGTRLVLEDFSRAKGRQVPGRLKVLGRDYSLSLELKSLSLELEDQRSVGGR